MSTDPSSLRIEVAQLKSALQWHRMVCVGLIVVLMAAIFLYGKEHANQLAKLDHAHKNDIRRMQNMCDGQINDDMSLATDPHPRALTTQDLQTDHEKEITELYNEFHFTLIQAQNNMTRFSSKTAGQYLYTLDGPSSDVVTSLATLEDELLVARDNGDVMNIERYDLNTIKFVGLLHVTGLERAADMDSCFSCECVFIADGNNDVIYRITKSKRQNVYHHSKWTVGYQIVALSATSTNGVLVVFNGVNEVHEYTSMGALVRTVHLQSDVYLPTQVIELDPSSRLYVVVDRHRNNFLRVCVVDSVSRNSINCIRFKTANESTVDVIANGYIFVTDSLTETVQLFTSLLQPVRDVIKDLSYPYETWLTRGLMFVVELDDSEVTENEGKINSQISAFQMTD